MQYCLPDTVGHLVEAGYLRRVG
ncbi:hypothetical protein [Phytoactinopolyspora endophytica]